MFRANGDGVPGDGGSELQTGVAIVGDGHTGAIAAAIVRQLTPDLGVVIVRGRGCAEPVAGQALSPEAAEVLAEIGLRERTDPPALIDRATTLGATLLRGVAVERVASSGDRIERLHLDDGRTVVADWYLDASGRTSEPTTSENCLLCGGTGVADFSTALTIGRDAGCTLAALRQGVHDGSWLRWSFHLTTRRYLSELQRRATDSQLEMRRCNVLKPNLVGARQGSIAQFRNGKVQRVPCYVRDGHLLPVTGVYEQLLAALRHHTVVADLLAELHQQEHGPLDRCVDGLDSMLQDGWLIGKFDGRRPMPEWPGNAKPSPTFATFTHTHGPIQK